MIYTVTLNPAVDYTVHLENLSTGLLNRSSYESIHYGGKGINVSMILTALGIPNIALGFTAGFTGEALEQALQQQGVQTRFIRLEQGMTRINVKIKTHEETEINGSGPEIDSQSCQQFLTNLQALHPDDYLVLAGSIPSGLPADFYSIIMEKVHPQVHVIVDTNGNGLLHTLPHHPFLIKPNRRELEEVLGTSCPTLDAAVQGARALIDQGARNVLVSLGAEGALLVDAQKKDYYVPALSGSLVDSVGAGDSMVAGFLWGWLDHPDPEYALRRGVLCGSATAFCEHLADRQIIEDLIHKHKLQGFS